MIKKKHKKAGHAEYVSICWDDIVGFCEFVEPSCWFKHIREKCEQEFKCTICDKSFLTKREFMIHRGKNHEQMIAQCKNEIKGSCTYGNENCWLTHIV